MQRNRSTGNMPTDDVRKVLRLTSGHASVADISKTTGVPERTVKRWKSRAKKLKLDYADVEKMGDSELDEKFRLKTGPKPQEHYPIDMQSVKKQLRDHYTVLDAFHTYETEAAAHEGAAPLLKQSAFFNHVRNYLRELAGNKSYSAQVWKTAEYLLVDAAGKMVKLTTPDGEVELPVYVAIVPSSTLIYAKVMEDRSAGQWIRAIVDTFDRIGGLPRHILCDNEKALVVDPTQGNKKLSQVLQQLVGFYDKKFDVEACRVASPRDKGYCEWAVKMVTDKVLKLIKVGSLLTKDDAQLAVEVGVNKLNDTESTETGLSPLEDFTMREQPKLQKLPDFRMIITEE